MNISNNLSTFLNYDFFDDSKCLKLVQQKIDSQEGKKTIYVLTEVDAPKNKGFLDTKRKELKKVVDFIQGKQSSWHAKYADNQVEIEKQCATLFRKIKAYNKDHRFRHIDYQHEYWKSVNIILSYPNPIISEKLTGRKMKISYDPLTPHKKLRKKAMKLVDIETTFKFKTIAPLPQFDANPPILLTKTIFIEFKAMPSEVFKEIGFTSEYKSKTLPYYKKIKSLKILCKDHVNVDLDREDFIQLARKGYVEGGIEGLAARWFFSVYSPPPRSSLKEFKNDGIRGKIAQTFFTQYYKNGYNYSLGLPLI